MQNSKLMEGDKRLYRLSWYNKKIGLASLLIASLLSSLLVGVILIAGTSSLVSHLTILAQFMLIFMVADAALIHLNLLIIHSHFDRILSGLRKRGLPYDSLLGIEAIQETMKKEIRYAAVLLASSLFSLVMFLVGVLGILMFVYLSLTSSLITLGFSVIRRKSPLDPDEMLEIYEPNIYPVVMSNDTLLETFIDPFHWLKFDDYKRELTKYLRKGISIGDALSKITFLLYQAIQGSITENIVREEVSELLKNKENLNRVEEHQTFGFRIMRIIIAKVKRFVPELTRLIDRLFLLTMDNLPDFKQTGIFIDAEASWEKRRGKTSNAFILLFNNRKDKEQRVSVSYNAPSFSPSSTEVVTVLPRRDFELPSADALPIRSEKGEDLVKLLSEVMDSAQFIWFSFETKETGGKPIFVSVKDTQTSDTIFAKTFVVDAHHDLSGLSLKIITTVSIILGVILSSFNFLRIFVGF